MSLKTDGVFYALYLTENLMLLMPRNEFHIRFTVVCEDVFSEDDLELL